MKELIDSYFELVEMDKEFVKKYNDNVFVDIIENKFIWRNIQNVDDIYNILKSNNSSELLKIQDYYIDELFSIYEKESGEESDETNQLCKKILNNEKYSDKLKACAKIVTKADSICMNLYNAILGKE